MEISVHDNFLLSYEVRCQHREICLRTEYRYRDPVEYTDIVFRGVEAYHFYHDNFQTIIFDIIEVAAGDILSDNRAQFEEGRRYGWPGSWNDSEATMKAHLTRCGVRGFLLSASIGMCGWILAASMEKIRQ